MRHFLILCFFLFLAGCSQSSLHFLGEQNPRERYSKNLEALNLTNKKLAKAWINQGELALAKPLKATVPFSEKGFLQASQNVALSWQFYAEQGTTIQVDLNWQSTDSSAVFVDLFSSKPLANLKGIDQSTDAFTYEIEQTGNYIIRLQGELLCNGQFTLSVKTTNTYGVFPVYGKNSKAVWSFFGVDRDGGKRKHEGIDIFAQKGTPVVAPTKGRITRVKNGGLGGKSVFMLDAARNQSLYFAHLDTQYVSAFEYVNIGDTLGEVGNTGNAKTTAPHLHFGIYKVGGAINPFAFINNIHETPVNIRLFTPLNKYQTTASTANLREGASTKTKIKNTVSSPQLITPISVQGDWLRVLLPNNTQAYIHYSLSKPIVKQPTETTENQTYYLNPFKDSTQLQSLAGWQEYTPITALGFFMGFELLENDKGMLLWRRS